MFYRVFRVREWESLANAEDFYEGQFAPPEKPIDLSPSVYNTDSAQLPQVALEHYATCKRSAPGHGHGVDVEGLAATLIPESTDSPFAFLRAAHHVVPHDGVATLKVFAALVWDKLKAGELTVHTPARDDMKRYLAAKLESDDLEWRDILNRYPDWKKFARLAPAQLKK